MGLLTERPATTSGSGAAAAMRVAGAVLCSLGRHRPAPNPRWNQGYGFTRCERCGRDLVRSLLGGWHVPRKHRVVWRPKQAAPIRKPVLPRPPGPAIDRTVRSAAAGTSATSRSPFDFGDFETIVEEAPEVPALLKKPG